MYYSSIRKSSTSESDKRKSSVLEDSKKKTSLLRDNSWIKREENNDTVDSNYNFGRSILSRFRSSENLSSSSDKNTSTVTSYSIVTSGTPTSPSRKNVQSLSKRFSASNDELDSNKLTASVETKTRTSLVKSPTKTETFSEKIFTDMKTNAGVTKTETVTVITSKDKTVQEDIKTVRTTTPVSHTKSSRNETVRMTTSKDATLSEGNKMVKSVTAPISPSKNTKTETVTVTSFKDTIVKEDSKTAKSAPPVSPSKNTKTETVTVTTFKDTIFQDDSKSAKSALPSSPTKNIKTESVTTTTFKDTLFQDDSKSAVPFSPTKRITSTTFSSASPTSKTTSYTSIYSTEDEVFEPFIPTSLKSTYGSDTRLNKLSETVVTESVKRVSSSSDSFGYGSRSGSTRSYSTTYTDRRPEDLSDIYTSRSTETVYTSAERKFLEKDLCTYCQKPMLAETKMILEDVDIKCHASCFKCDVCQSPLGHLKAGDNMWLYRRSVHCETCFGVAKNKWHR